MEKVWEKVTDILKINLSGSGYQTFSSSSEPKSFVENILTIEVQNEFSKSWIKEKCEPILRDNFQNTPYNTLILNYVINKQEPSSSDNEQLSIFPKNDSESPKESLSFNPKYSFDNFILYGYIILSFIKSAKYIFLILIILPDK